MGAPTLVATGNPWTGDKAAPKARLLLAGLAEEAPVIWSEGVKKCGKHRYFLSGVGSYKVKGGVLAGKAPVDRLRARPQVSS